MGVYLKAYDSNGKLLATGHEITEDQGSVIIASLTPNTFYPKGSFFVSWQGDNFETEKVEVPEFETHESTHKEFVFYFKDYIMVKGKSAYDLAMENGFTGSVQDWLMTIKGDPMRFEDLTPAQKEQIRGPQGNGLEFDGVVADASALPTGNTKSIYLVGTTVYSRAQGSTTWVKGADIKSKVTIVDGVFAIDGVKTNVPVDESAVQIAMKNWVASRGQNLVTNGNGSLGTNENFLTFSYDTNEFKSGFGSFKYDGPTSSSMSSEYIPVDTTKAYALSTWAKSKNSTGQQYFGIACYDVDKNVINPINTLLYDSPVVKLAQPLKKGDKKIYVTDISQWLDPTSPWVTVVNSVRGVILWKYKNKSGYEYPEKTYSRYGQIGIDSVNETEKSITLTSPWAYNYNDSSDGVFPAGHPITRGASGSAYMYTTLGGQKLPSKWSYYSNTILAGELAGSDRNFRPGTAYARVLFLLNYGNGGADVVYYNNVDFREHIGDFATAGHNHDLTYSKLGHTHFASEILMAQGQTVQQAIEGKADINHDHDKTYAKLTHSHAINDVTGLTNELSNKSNKGHLHTGADITDLKVYLDKKSDISHDHDDVYLKQKDALTQSKADARYVKQVDAFTVEMARNLFAPIGSFDGTSLELDLSDYLKMEDGDVRYASKSHKHQMNDIQDLITTLATFAPLTHNHDGIYAKKTEVLTRQQADQIYAKIGSVGSGGVIEKSSLMKDVADFGLIGDNKTNNYEAIKAWRDHAQNYPGTIYWVNPIYVGADEKPVKAVYRSTEYKRIKNIDGVPVDGTPGDIEWTLKDITIYANGALFVSMPETGFTKTPTFETAGGWYAKEEHLTLFNFQNCENLTVYNLNTSGEVEKVKFSAGVTTAEGTNARYNGKQVSEGRGHGVIIGGGRHLKFVHLRSHRYSVDGLAIGFTRDWNSYKMINSEFVTLEHCDFHYNGRLGASGLGLFGVKDINCTFNYNGTILFNAPGMGFDLEPHGSPLGADNLWHESLASQNTTKWRADKWNGNYYKHGGEIIGNRGGAVAVTSSMLTRNVIFEAVTIGAGNFPSPYYLITASAQNVIFRNCDLDGTLKDKKMAIVFPFGYGDIIAQPTGILLSDFASVKTIFEGGQQNNIDYWTNDDDTGLTIRNDVKIGERGLHETVFNNVAFNNCRMRYNHSRRTTMTNCQWVFTDEQQFGYFNLWNAYLDNNIFISKRTGNIFLDFGAGDNRSSISNLEVTKGKFSFKDDAPYLTKTNTKESIETYDRTPALDYAISRAGTGTGGGADTTPPNAPFVNDISTDSTAITGMAEPNSEVTATFQGGVIAKATASSSYLFSITKPANVTLTASQTVSVTAKDMSGNISAPTVKTITQGAVVTPPGGGGGGDTTPPNAPTVNTVYTTNTTITGTAEANSTVTATFNINGSKATATASSGGAYTITVPGGTSLVAGNTINVTATDASGNVSSPTTVTIQASAPASLYPNTTKASGTVTATDGIYQLNNVLALSWNNDPFTLSASTNTITITDNKAAHTVYALWTMPKAKTKYTVKYSVTNSRDLSKDPIGVMGIGSTFTGGAKQFSFTTDANKKFGFNFLWGPYGDADVTSTGLFHVTNGAIGSTTTYTITSITEG